MKFLDVVALPTERVDWSTQEGTVLPLLLKTWPEVPLETKDVLPAPLWYGICPIVPPVKLVDRKKSYI